MVLQEIITWWVKVTSKQVIDVEKFVDNVLSQSGVKSSLTDNEKYVLLQINLNVYHEI